MQSLSLARMKHLDRQRFQSETRRSKAAARIAAEMVFQRCLSPSRLASGATITAGMDLALIAQGWRGYGTGTFIEIAIRLEQVYF